MIEDLLFVAESKRSECEEMIEDTLMQMDLLVEAYLTKLFSINNKIKESGMYAGQVTTVGSICPYVKKEHRHEFSPVYLEYRKYTKSKVASSPVLSRRLKSVTARHKSAIATENYYSKQSITSWTKGRQWETVMLWDFEIKARGLRALFSTYYKTRKELLRMEQELKKLIEEGKLEEESKNESCYDF